MFASTRIVRVHAPVEDAGECTTATSVAMRAHAGEHGVAVRRAQGGETHLTDVSFADGTTVTYDDAWLEPDDVPLASLEPIERVLLLLVAERLARTSLAQEVRMLQADAVHATKDIKRLMSLAKIAEARCDATERRVIAAHERVRGETDERKMAVHSVSHRTAALEAVFTTLVPKLESISETLSMQRELEAIGMMKDADTPASKRPRKD